MPACLRHALAYARAGLAVFPVVAGGKAPATRRGFYDASSEEADVVDWFDGRDLNIGIATGAVSRLLVIDIDPRNEGPTTWRIERQPDGGRPIVAETGGGGQHLCWRYDGPPRRWRKTLGPGVDLKADGGYIVAPPSLHPSGGVYRWSSETRGLEPAPAWLLERCTAPEPVVRDPGPAPAAVERASGWAMRAMDGEYQRVAHAPKGERNNALNRAAHALGQIVAGGALSRDSVERWLLMAAAACGLSEGEARQTIRSGMTAGERSPRWPTTTR